MFSKREFKDLFSQYLLVQLYADWGGVPDEFYAPQARAGFGGSADRQKADARVNSQFADLAFGSIELPRYAILSPRPDGKIDVLALSGGKINNNAEFERFLREPLEGGK